MAPPPPPPPSSEEATAMPMLKSMMVTPPQKHKTPFGYSQNYRRHGPSISKTATSSPATSHASSTTSPSQMLLKTCSAGEVTSPRVRGTRMDPYPRYSPRKRFSADFSDGTFSGESGTDSPRSEKGGWRIHAAVSGPFLTGPLATDFTPRMDELRSPRGKKTDAPDFEQSGLLLFPVVPDFVAPAITPEVFQASIQPAPVTMQAQPQPEPDYSAAAQQTDAGYYPPNTDQYYEQQAAAAWDAAQQQQYYYADQQEYSAEQQQYYYNNGYDQQYNVDAAYTNGEYNYQQTFEQSYDQTYEQTYEQSSVQATEDFSVTSPQNADAFPPLPTQTVASPEIETPSQSTIEDVAASNQQVESAVPSSQPRRSRAPSYAEVVAGALPTTLAVTEAEAPKSSAAKASFASFDQLSDGIADSMSRILSKSDGKQIHAEVEFACLVRRVQTQLKLMGRVSNNLHLKQMKTLHQLQKSEIEKLSVESSNMNLVARVQKYEQEQEELKKQLTEALAAKDVRLQDAVDQLAAKLDSLKNSTDASTASLAAEIDAIRKCSSSDDLEKRVEEIGRVIDYLIENQTDASSSKRRPSRQSVGSWKSIVLYAIVVWAASLCGVWVGVKYAGTANQTPVVVESVVGTPLVLDTAAVVEPTPTFFEEATPAVDVDVELPAVIDASETVVESVRVHEEVGSTMEAVEEIAEVTTFTEVVEEVKVPVEASVVEVEEPALVFMFEQMPRSSPSCFTCLTDHSTMASFFCEMLSEVIENSIVVEEPVTAEEIVAADETSTEPVVEVAVSPAADVFADVSVSENWYSMAAPSEEIVATVEDAVVLADEVVAPAEIAMEAVVEALVISAVVESVPSVTTRRQSVTNMMSSPLAHALYVWCPSLFDMNAEEEKAVSGPLGDLARALTSLSSQILSENTLSTVKEVAEESEAAAFEVVEEVEEQAVDQIEAETEVAEGETAVADDVIEVEATTTVEAEVVADEITPVEAEAPVAAPSNRWATEQFLINVGVLSGTAEVTTAVEAEVVADETTEVEDGAPVAALSNRWATEQFLINVGVLSGTAEVVVPEAAEQAVEAVAAVEEVFAETVESTKIVDGAIIESTPSTIEAAPLVEETDGSCPLERFPRFEDAVVKESKFANTSLVVAEPLVQLDEEINETIGSSPAIDLKSLLFTSS